MAYEITYIATILFDIALINVFVFWRNKRTDKRLVRSLREFVVVVSISVLTAMLAIKLPYQELSLFLQTVHYASTEWMLIFLINFMEVYVGEHKMKWTVPISVLIGIYSMLCTISFFLNAAFHHVATNAVEIVNGDEIFVFTTYSPWFELHAYFCYLLILWSLVILIRGIMRASKIYRRRYYILLVILVLTIGMDGLCVAMHFQHDFSLYGYCALCFFFTFFALHYSPRGVITQTLAYLVEDYHSRVMCFDPEDKCIYVNEEARKAYGKDTSLEVFEAQCKKLMKVESFRAIGEDKKWQYERELDGEKVYFRYKFTRLFDERKRYLGCYISITDQTEEMRELERQKYLASHDSLTGLYNKDYFYDQVDKIIRFNPKKRYYIFVTDIKDFKLVNDLFGYEKGDELLIGLARKLDEFLTDEMLCARITGDRFAFCVPEELYDETYLVNCIAEASKLLRTSEFQLRIHAGVYEAPAGGSDEDVYVMCDHAVMAIRTIKDDYDRIIAYYDEDLMNKMLNQKFLINEFEDALQGGQFAMYLQPQVDVDGAVLGAEALARWIHPERGMISPGEFIPVFEDAGLIHRLDQCIWEQAAKKLREWKDGGREDLHISVNISTKDFYYLDIFKVFTELVEKYEISPEKLKLEITESALMQDMDKQLELLLRLQSYGFHVEIDDFGSGYSSLNMLKNIKADVLKIDMGFLQEIQDHERTRIILGMVVDLAKRLQMIVITEGVENKAQVDYLKNVGCDMFQGFYFERPIPVREFETEYM